MDGKSLDILSDKLSKLKELVPEAFTEDKIDLGFKVFKLAPSNFKIWRSEVVENSKELNKMMGIFDDRVKEKTGKENMLYELMLKPEYVLIEKIEKKNGETIIILDKISKKTIEEIIETKPKNCIALDKLFLGNDKLKTNTAL